MNPYITDVAARSFKGSDFTHKLQPLTIIAGPNMAGKTGITDAIRLALLGKLPEVGNKPGDAYKFSSSSKMTVAVKFSDDTTVQRSVEESRGSIKCTPAKIDPLYSSALLQMDEWFLKTARERIDYVFTHVDMPQDKTPAGIIATLQRISFDEGHSEIVEAAKQAVISDVKDVFTREMGPLSELSRLPDAIVAAESSLAEDFTLWNRRAKDSEGAIRIVAELKMREAECTAATLTDLRETARQREAELAAANEALGALRQQQTGARNLARRREEIEHALKQPQPVAKEVAPFRSSINIEEVRSSLRHANETLEKSPQPSTTELDNARSDYQKKRLLTANIGSEISNLEANIEEKEAELDAIQAMGLCKDCTKKLGAAIEDALKAKRGALSQRQPALTTAAQEREEAMGVMRRLETAYDGAAEVIHNRDNLLSTIRSHENAVATWERSVESATAQNVSELRNWENRMRSLREELGRLDDSREPSTDQMTLATAAVGTATAALTNAREKLRTAETLAHDIKRESQAAEEAEKAAAKRDVIKAVKEKLTEIKGELVGSAFAAVLDVANTIGKGVMRAPLEYDTETSQIGQRINGAFVSHETFSGTEKLLTYVAVSVGLAAKAPVRIAILDELARLTQSMQARVMDNLDDARMAGVIDQAIVIIPSETPMYRGDAWHIINLEAAK